MFQFATIAMYTAHLRAPSGAAGVKPKKKAQSQENLLRGETIREVETIRRLKGFGLSSSSSKASQDFFLWLSGQSLLDDI